MRRKAHRPFALTLPPDLSSGARSAAEVIETSAQIIHAAALLPGLHALTDENV